ncbi:hypothetical protein [Streptomyces sp. 2P-4]|uniref:hypothetical protein n=1 Tax=Streptomyces sp. 2P-4 TaxID=2931974 RepID=UPI00253FF311|nr:hypothetical protein [Streptomyces sp. 2P-4]
MTASPVSAPAAAGPREPRPAAGGLAEGLRRTLLGVLGAGLLVLPGVLGPVPAATVAAVAAALAGWCLLVAAAGGTDRGGPTAFVRDRLGPRAARAATALYFGGFATGQAAVALAAGGYAAAGFAPAGDSGWRAHLAAAAVLAAAACRAWLSPQGPSPAARRLRLASVAAVAAAWWGLGGPLPGSGATGWWAALAAVPLLFGWVGLEGAVPSAARPRVLAGTLLGLAAAAALYAVLAAPPGPSAPEPHPVAAAALGAAAAVLCWSYCRTNLQAAAARWTELGGRSRRGGVLAGAALALAFLAAGAAADWPAAVLLAGPGTATAALYCLIAVAALRRPRPKEHTA